MKSRVGPPHCVHVADGAGVCATSERVAATVKVRTRQSRVGVISLWTLHHPGWLLTVAAATRRAMLVHGGTTSTDSFVLLKGDSQWKIAHKVSSSRAHDEVDTG